MRWNYQCYDAWTGSEGPVLRYDQRIGLDRWTAMKFESRMEQFRIADRELFNSYFRLENPYGENWNMSATLKEDHDRIQHSIFQNMICRRFGLSDVLYGEPHSEIRVKLRNPDTPVMVNREVSSGNWDHGVEKLSVSTVLHFLSYFDFDVYGVRDNKYVRVLIHQSDEVPEIEGKHALIETSEAIDFGDGSEKSTRSGRTRGFAREGCH